MPSSPSSDSILPSYSVSAPISPPPHSRRESVYAIIASYALPSKTRPPKSRRAPPPPALRLIPAHSVVARTQAVQYPPSPLQSRKEKTPVKWEWSAPVGGEEEGVVVAEDAKEDVFSAVQEAEREAVADKRVTITHRGWTPKTDGPKISLRAAVGVAQVVMVTTSLLLLVLVLCSPLKILPSAGLLVINLDDRVLTLGALGGCLRDLKTGSRSCSGSSLTPFFADIFAESSIPSSSVRHLPYSFPLFPAALALSIAALFTALVALSALNFPRRRSAAGSRGRKTLLLVAVTSIGVALVLGLPASIAQWSALAKMVESAEGVEVEVGSSFHLLWTAWVLVGLAIVGWGVQGRGEEEQEDGKAAKSDM